MNITPRFALAIKLSLIVVIIMSIYSFVLSYYGMEGFSISHPSENTGLRIALNYIETILFNISFWLLIGFIINDYKAALIAILVFIILFVVKEVSIDSTIIEDSPKDFSYYLFTLSGLFPCLAFGLAHFKSSIGLKLLVYWVITWIFFDCSVLERFIYVFTSIFGLRSPFEIHISTGENSYRVISIFQIFCYNLFLIVDLLIFYWTYQLIKTKKSIWETMQTCFSSIGIDRLSYSIIYWSFRITLSVAAMGILSYIVNSFRSPLDIYTILKVILGACGLVIAASIYRNFLVSFITRQNKYPGGLFILLNLPLINIFAWIFSLVNFISQPDKPDNINQLKDRFTALQANFIKEGRNKGWKTALVIFSIIGLLYQPVKRMGYSGIGGDGVVWILLSAIISIGLLMWFLINKNSYKVLLILLCTNIVLAAIIRDKSIIQPAMGAHIVNLVLLYAMFYFDEFKWEEVSFAPEERLEVEE